MTREKWAKLTDDEKRIKVAELCGWEDCFTPFPLPMRGYRRYDGQIGEDPESVPDYLHDLNAMHDVVMGLSEDDTYGFFENLLVITGVDATNDDWMEERKLFCATAAQRAEAFALTMEPE